MSAPRPSEADVEALVEEVCPCDGTAHSPGESMDCGWALMLARAVLGSDWLAARDAEHERPKRDDIEEEIAARIATALAQAAQEHDREVAALREANDFLGTEHMRLEEAYGVQADLLNEAERTLADRDAAIKALADEWAVAVARLKVAVPGDVHEGESEQTHGIRWATRTAAERALSDLRALLPRDDAAGAGGAE